MQAATPLHSPVADTFRLFELRWLSVVAMVAIGLFALPLIAPSQPLAPLLAVVLMLAGLNLALLAGAGRWLGGVRGAFLQLALDLLAWGVFLYFSGGPTNPAISLLLPLIAVGATILPARRAWLLVLLAVVIYSLLWEFHLPVAIDDRELAMRWHLAGMWLSFALAAATVVWFVARLTAALSQRERELADTRAARARDAYMVALGKLAAGAAHRLGTPLGTLRLLADELAERPDLAPDTREDLALMRTQIDNCKSILHGLTVEAGQQRAEGGGPVRAGDWLAGVVARWQDLRPLRKAELDCSAAAADAVLVVDDSLGEALHNVIDNAANASTGSVEVGAALRDGRLVLEVADRGPGIEPALSAAAISGARAGKSSGMGVGLFLAHDAIEHHRGRMEFLPRPGGGTIVRIDLPAQDTTR
ncbi:MAG: HAMP domain-containing histidine kinase [Thauera phenolivorans]|uniref:histidine kinase n=1 Tax=Thauera phenolivorans TaxID=1792543 RepID=A0A7X7LWF2_9RHOO|nr:ATP-binding protein [Thauera phenolivorans]NLF54498.1 HAMP domain-containing histidine kinase [Thauera phenolivorans]